MKTFWSIIKKLALFIGGMYLWIMFAFNTLYRDAWALTAGAGNPLPNEWAFLALPAMLSFIFWEEYSKEGVWGFLFKLIMVLLFILGILMFVVISINKP